MHRRNFLLSAGAAFLSALGTDAFAKSEELVLAFIPQENPEKLIGDIKVITSWLTEQIGIPVRGYVTADHSAAIEALRNADADISFMGALPFVIAEKEIGAEVILSEIYRGQPTYTGRVFVRRDSGIMALKELQGKAIAFADPLSESGYLYPLDTFVKEGLLKRGQDPKAFFAEVFFAGGYQQAMQAVATGLVDAAGASEYAELLLTPEQQAEIRWIAQSKPIPSHTVIARKELDQKIRAKFVIAMLKLNKTQNKYLLRHVYSPDGYVKANPGAFSDVRLLAKSYGFLK